MEIPLFLVLKAVLSYTVNLNDIVVSSLSAGPKTTDVLTIKFQSRVKYVTYSIDIYLYKGD